MKQLLFFLLLSQLSWANGAPENPYANHHDSLAARGCQFALYGAGESTTQTGRRTAVLRFKKTGRLLYLIEDRGFGSLDEESESRAHPYKASQSNEVQFCTVGCLFGLVGAVGCAVCIPESPLFALGWGTTAAFVSAMTGVVVPGLLRDWVVLLKTFSFEEMALATQSRHLVKLTRKGKQDFDVRYDGNIDDLLKYLLKFPKYLELESPFQTP